RIRIAGAPGQPGTTHLGFEPGTEKQPALRDAARLFADHGGAGQSDAERSRVPDQSSRPARRPGKLSCRSTVGGGRMVAAARSDRSGIHNHYDSNQVSGRLARVAGSLRSLMRNAFSIAPDPRAVRTAVLAHPGTWILLAVVVLAVATPVLAEHTRWWRQTTFEDFDKGTAKGVALRSDGKMFLAPRFAEFADANLAYLLQIRADAKGNLYAA